ncbi:hypothetical protein D4765_13140 [Subtercola vilae]|uniref:Uncharacterized protein n=1 Tax=Subtercola vilae TaxID=2056433 RepID=A0A4V4REK0_9MICO|nr:hypothetical protein D4765_13140 [Subtercola vilae]
MPHDEQPLTRRQLRDLERQKPRKQQKEEAKALDEAEAQRKADEATAAARDKAEFDAQAAAAVSNTPAPAVETIEPEPVEVESESVTGEHILPVSDADSDGTDVSGTEASVVDADVVDAEVVDDTGSHSFDDVLTGVATIAPAPNLSRRARRALSADHPFAGTDADTSRDADEHPVPAGEAAPATGPIIAEIVPEDLSAGFGADLATDANTIIQHDDDADHASVEPTEEPEAEAPAPVIEELMVVDEVQPADISAAEEDELAEIDDTPAPDAVHIITIDDGSSAPILAPLFQAPAEREVVASDPTLASFDDLIASRGVGSSNIASTSALVLPSVPNHGDVGTALDETGEVIITGSIDLPMSLGSTGAAPADGLESAELDAFLDSDAEIGSDVAPVSATRAISTHGTNSGLVAPPKRRGATAPVVLAVTAGVLAIGVVGLLLAAFVFRIF